jgi:hypothetical protein
LETQRGRGRHTRSGSRHVTHTHELLLHAEQRILQLSILFNQFEVARHKSLVLFVGVISIILRNHHEFGQRLQMAGLRLFSLS